MFFFWLFFLYFFFDFIGVQVFFKCLYRSFVFFFNFLNEFLGVLNEIFSVVSLREHDAIIILSVCYQVKLIEFDAVFDIFVIDCLMVIYDFKIEIGFD